MFSLWGDQPHSYSGLKSSQPCHCYKFKIGMYSREQGSLKQEVCRLYSVPINNNQCPYINSVPKVSIPVTFTLAWDQFCSLRYPLCYVMGSTSSTTTITSRGPECCLLYLSPLHQHGTEVSSELNTSVVSDDG